MDGFITNVVNLEQKLLQLPIEDCILLRKYRTLRGDFSGVSDALEIKSCGKGVIS